MASFLPSPTMESIGGKRDSLDVAYAALDAPAVKERSWLLLCCGSLWDGLVWVTGCKDDDWLAEGRKPTPTAVLHGVKEPQFYVGEAEWPLVKKWVFFPVSPRKMAFDLLVMLGVVYSCVAVPYHVAFGDVVSETHNHAQWLLEVAIQVLFTLDLLFNFNTAFLHDEQWILHRPAIARNYLRGWFWVDAPASLPIVEILHLYLDYDETATPEELKLVRAIRLFRILRLLKMFKLGEVVRMVEFATGLDLKALQVFFTLVLLLAFTHLVACIFYGISLVSASSYDSYWVLNEFGSPGGDEATSPPIERYMDTLLWAVGLFIGINSPIAPANTLEQLSAAIIYVFSLFLFALVVAVVTQQRLAYTNDPFVRGLGLGQGQHQHLACARVIRLRASDLVQHHHHHAPAMPRPQRPPDQLMIATIVIPKLALPQKPHPTPAQPPCRRTYGWARWPTSPVSIGCLAGCRTS